MVKFSRYAHYNLLKLSHLLGFRLFLSIGASLIKKLIVQ